MKRIYLISLFGTGNAGGVERVTYYLQQILSEKFEVHVLKKGRLSFGKLDKFIYPILISLILFFIPNKIVIANSWHCFLYPADYSIHHGTSAGSMSYCGFSFSLKINAWMEKISAKLAKSVLSVSENCKNELINIYKIKKEKIVVLNNFVDEEKFYPLNKQNDTTIKVVFSGSLCKRKGVNKLTELADYLLEYNKNSLTQIKLIIATNNKTNSNLFENNPFVEINIGLTVNDMNNFYNKGDILFFPTLYEGFSMSTLEALASGLPVIGTKFAVPKELEFYDFCYLINENISCKELCDKLIEIKKKWQNKSNAIHNLIIKDFGKESYKYKLLNLL